MRSETVVIGEVITADGIARQQYVVQPEPERVGPLLYRARPPELRRRSFALRATEVRTAQAPWIGIDYGHDRDRILGHVEHLERLPSGAVYAVGTIYGERPEGTLYFSPATTERRSDGGDVLIERIALTGSPAQICLEEVSFYDGDLRGYAKWQLPERYRGLVERAARISRSRSASDPIEVYDGERRSVGLDERAGMGPLRYGPPSPILRVG
jgi:hypothetical protein